MSTKTVQVKPLTLSSGIGTGNTTAIVSGMVGLDGLDLTQADFGSIIYGTFEPNTTREEAVSFTITSCTGGVANINFTASGRGLKGKAPYGTGGIAYSHSSGAKLVISNNPNLFDKFTAKDNDEIVTGQWQFPTPTGPNSPVTKTFAESLAIAGASDASANTKGLSRLSVSPNVTIGVATITIATPAVISKVAHGLTLNDTIQFTTTGALPTGLLASTTYYVISAGLAADSFRISTTLGGSAINTTGSQSGVHTLIKTTPVAVGNEDTRIPTQSENDALAGTSSQIPSSDNKFLLTNISVTAGETINGATLPVPVYQDTSSFKYLACDGNVLTKLSFQGFATSNSTDTNPILMQSEGIVAGFTGLTRGAKYYLQDAVGTIGTTPGTYEILVGIAISTTELLIQKGRRTASGTLTVSATGATVITTGFRANRVRVHAVSLNRSGATITAQSLIRSDGGWTKFGGQQCLAIGYTTSGGFAVMAIQNGNYSYQLEDNIGSIGHYGQILSVTDTTFTINNTKASTAANGIIFWEAEGDI